MKWTYRGTLALLVLAGGTLTAGLAVAGGDGERGGANEAGIPAAEQEAIDRFCPSDEPCAVVDVDADTRVGEKRIGEQLATIGKAPEECAEAAAALSERGRPVDAFVGRCPTRSEAEELAMSAGSPGGLEKALATAGSEVAK